MKYQVGDRVRIRNDLEENVGYDTEGIIRYIAINEMPNLKGQIVTISQVFEKNDGYYNIEEDNNRRIWTIGMFDSDFQTEQPVFAEDEWKSLMDF